MTRLQDQRGVKPCSSWPIRFLANARRLRNLPLGVSYSGSNGRYLMAHGDIGDPRPRMLGPECGSRNRAGEGLA